MTIKEAIELFYTDSKVVFEGEATSLQAISSEEIGKNKLAALKELNEKSKGELIEYILYGEKDRILTY